MARYRTSGRLRAPRLGARVHTRGSKRVPRSGARLGFALTYENATSQQRVAQRLGRPARDSLPTRDCRCSDTERQRP